METAVIVLASAVVALIGWILLHSSQCSRFHERVARLEERVGIRDTEGR